MKQSRLIERLIASDDHDENVTATEFQTGQADITLLDSSRRPRRLADFTLGRREHDRLVVLMIDVGRLRRSELYTTRLRVTR